MLEFADDSGVGSFTITNTEEHRQFINVLISDVDIVDGELVKTPYSRDNIAQWSLEARPSRTVVDAKLQKDFKMLYRADAQRSETHDKLYQLTFVPTPYFPEGEKPQHAVQLAIGFAPYFVVPAAIDQPLDYQLSHQKEVLKMKNNGSSYIRAFFNACPKEAKAKEREQCSKVVYVMAGRQLSIELTPEMQQAAQIKTELTSHRLTYKNEHVLQPGQVVTH
ncbi:hypothetical protein [Vibrio alfacsensis]|uniref:hypothetical protein n=1 Tax=Vibrio alfacsensis TaxID=1074311 RepID=UPI004067FCA6